MDHLVTSSRLSSEADDLPTLSPDQSEILKEKDDSACAHSTLRPGTPEIRGNVRKLPAIRRVPPQFCCMCPAHGYHDNTSEGAGKEDGSETKHSSRKDVCREGDPFGRLLSDLKEPKFQKMILHDKDNDVEMVNDIGDDDDENGGRADEELDEAIECLERMRLAFAQEAGMNNENE